MADKPEPSPPSSSPSSNPFARFFRRLPKQSRSRAVVQAVITAFEEQLVGSEDDSGWRLERLADRAGVGIGSFYEYFSNKESLLGALVGNVTERNFRELLTVVEADYPDALAFAEAVGLATARAYLERPHTTRVVLGGIARFGLMRYVIDERDRFVVSLARATHRYYADRPLADIEYRTRIAADAVMGRVVAELYRGAPVDVERSGHDLAALAYGIVIVPMSLDGRPAPA